MHRMWLCLSVIVLLVAGLASAEFYKYYDENGNVHFTDDYNRIPEDQRPDVKSYVESTSPSEETPEPEDLKTDQASAKASSENKPSQLAQELKALDERRDALDKEYQSLIEENEKLEQTRKTVKTAEDLKKYNDSVKALNQKLQAHDKKRQAYAADVETYNAKVVQANAAKMNKNQPEPDSGFEAE